MKMPGKIKLNKSFWMDVLMITLLLGAFFILSLLI